MYSLLNIHLYIICDRKVRQFVLNSNYKQLKSKLCIPTPASSGFLNLIEKYHTKHMLCLPPPRQPSGIVLASSAGGPGFNPQSRTASYQIRYNNGTSSSLIWHAILNSEILAFSEEYRQDKNVMDTIWDRYPSKSEVIGRCSGDEKTNDHAEPTQIEL